MYLVLRRNLVKEELGDLEAISGDGAESETDSKPKERKKKERQSLYVMWKTNQECHLDVPEQRCTRGAERGLRSRRRNSSGPRRTQHADHKCSPFPRVTNKIENAPGTFNGTANLQGERSYKTCQHDALAQGMGCRPANPQGPSPIPSQGTGLGCGPGPQLGVGGGN